MSIPKTHRALVVAEGNKGVEVTEKKLPAVARNEILINVKVVSLNPTDLWHVYSLLKPGDSTGNDFAGVVVQVGSDAKTKDIKVGDAVVGFVRGGSDDPDNGAFQEYVKIRPELVWRKPDSIPFQEATALGGVASATAGWTLYRFLGVQKPWETSLTTKNEPVLIWAGSTSVGLAAVTLAKLSGLTVITTASPRNHDLLKSLGANAVFDYRDANTPNKIQTWVKENGFGATGIQKAFDAISKDRSTKLVAECLGEQGGKIITVLPGDPNDKYSEGVVIKSLDLYNTLHEENKQDFHDLKELNEMLPTLIEQRGLRNPIPVALGKGLEAISGGFQYIGEGKVSAQKLVYTDI